MKPCRGFGIVRKAALELLLRPGLRFLLMLLERGGVSRFVYLEALFFGKFHRHFKRESEGVVKPERRFAADRSGGDMRYYLFEFFKPLLQCGAEFFLFLVYFGPDFFRVVGKIAVFSLVNIHVHARKFGKNAVPEAEYTAESYRAPDKTAQYVALIHVGRRYPSDVADYEGCRTYVVGHYPDGFCRLLILAVYGTRKLAYSVDDGRKQIGFVYRPVPVEYA